MRPAFILLFSVFAIQAAGTEKIDGAENAPVLVRTVPLSPKVTYTKAQWAAIVESLKPKADDENAQKIRQPPSAGKVAKNNVVTGQIVGGENATRGQFPWHVTVYFDGGGLCGGSLILSNWVLTAAHCAYKSKSFTVILGSTDPTKVPEGGLTLTTTEKFVHHLYDPSTLNNDVALLKLPQNVTSTR